MAEKTQQEIAREKMTDQLLNALEKAKSNDGMLLNPSQKLQPSIYGRRISITPMSKLVMGIHSDQSDSKTNTYALFNDVKNRGEAIKKGEHGVPLVTVRWDDQHQPKVEYRTVHNIDQTTMPQVNKEEYNAEVRENGTQELRKLLQNENFPKEEKQLRVDVNQFILNVRDNLVPIRKDGNGIASYDSQKDVVHIPAQNVFASYADYVQEVARQVVTATGHEQRNNRAGMFMEGKHTPTAEAQQHERLVVELASAVKMLEFGLPAKISKESMELIPKWQDAMRNNPNYIGRIEMDVNRAINMIGKAERGEKVQLQDPKQLQKEKWDKQFPITPVPEKFEQILMLKDKDEKWTLFIKPYDEQSIAIHPKYEDVGLFFDMLKDTPQDEKTYEFRIQFAQKYYAEAQKDPDKKVNLFTSNATEEDLAKIDKVHIFKTKDDPNKILCVATIDGEKQKAKYVSPEMWNLMWLADDMKDYKKHMAATLYADVLHPNEAQTNEQKQATSPKVEGTPAHEEQEHKDFHAEQDAAKAKEKAKENAPKLSPMVKQFLDLKKKHPDALLLFRCGDFYETYMKDAEKASKVLGITLTRSTKAKDPDGKPLAMAGFPYHALDTYLPKLIRAGERVAICDQIEDPRRTAGQGAKTDGEEKAAKHAVTEEIVPQKKQEEEQSRGFHR